MSEGRSVEDSVGLRARSLLGDDPDATGFLDRLERWLPELREGLDMPYGEHAPLDRVVAALVKAHRARRPELRRRDRQALLRPDWFQQPTMIGYAAYADRFADDLAGVRRHVPYLAELGVTYLHLMPLLRTREGADDGGYAVVDFDEVRPALGTMADLEALADTLHEHGIALTLDLVLNHVAREHRWAAAARAGDAEYAAYFHTFADRSTPDAYEATLPEVFPTFAPGNFTWDADLDAWVWTTFNSWQWDLRWSNPDVFCALLDVVLSHANRGVDCLRLDAIAFIWKRLGTMCQNEPEVHAITEALRAATRVAAPAVAFKAEAIVGPDHVGAYLGQGRFAGKVSDLAYDNTLMVHLWSALATRDTRMLVAYRHRLSTKPTTTAWATYLRCHDDIGWALDDHDTGPLGWSGQGHRDFLTAFYTGAYDGSFARGLPFQVNTETGDARVCGTAASLAGLETALADGDTDAVDRALARLFCLHAIMFGYGGLPLLYMGDELALCNDYGYVDVPEHADDARWLHRPHLPWDVAERRHDPITVEGRVFAGIRHLAAVRASLPPLHASVEPDLYDTGNPAVFTAVRRHAAGVVVQVYNLSEHWEPVRVDALRHGLRAPYDVLNDEWPVDGLSDVVGVPPYAAWWLVEHA